MRSRTRIGWFAVPFALATIGCSDAARDEAVAGSDSTMTGSTSAPANSDVIEPADTEGNVIPAPEVDAAGAVLPDACLVYTAEELSNALGLQVALLGQPRGSQPSPEYSTSLCEYQSIDDSETHVSVAVLGAANVDMASAELDRPKASSFYRVEPINGLGDEAMFLTTDSNLQTICFLYWRVDRFVYYISTSDVSGIDVEAVKRSLLELTRVGSP